MTTTSESRTRAASPQDAHPARAAGRSPRGAPFPSRAELLLSGRSAESPPRQHRPGQVFPATPHVPPSERVSGRQVQTRFGRWVRVRRTGGRGGGPGGGGARTLPPPEHTSSDGARGPSPGPRGGAPTCPGRCGPRRCHLPAAAAGRPACAREADGSLLCLTCLLAAGPAQGQEQQVFSCPAQSAWSKPRPRPAPPPGEVPPPALPPAGPLRARAEALWLGEKDSLLPPRGPAPCPRRERWCPRPATQAPSPTEGR